MPLAKNITDYQAYLLRIWRRGKEEPAQWQASLEDPHTGERMGFANLSELIAYLYHLTQISSIEPD